MVSVALISSKKDAYKGLIRFIETHGAPSRIVTDNGGGFMTFWDTVTTFYEIQTVSGAARSPWSNGRTEQLNRSIKKIFTILKAGFPYLSESSIFDMMSIALNEVPAPDTLISPREIANGPVLSAHDRKSVPEGLSRRLPGASSERTCM